MIRIAWRLQTFLIFQCLGAAALQIPASWDTTWKTMSSLLFAPTCAIVRWSWLSVSNWKGTLTPTSTSVALQPWRLLTLKINPHHLYTTREKARKFKLRETKPTQRRQLAVGAAVTATCVPELHQTPLSFGLNVRKISLRLALQIVDKMSAWLW